MSENQRDLKYHQEWHSTVSKDSFQQGSNAELDLIRLVDPEKLFAVAKAISTELVKKCQDSIDQNAHLKLLLEPELVRAGEIRAEEIQQEYMHTRPNGKEGIDTPYLVGYGKKNNVEAEVLAAVESDSLKKLLFGGAEVLANQLLDQVLPALGEFHSNEIGGAVAIHENTTGFVATGVLFFAEKKAEIEVISPEILALKKARKQLAKAYNISLQLVEDDYSASSWSKLMLARARGKRYYQQKNSSIDSVISAAEDLEQACKALEPNSLPLKLFPHRNES